MSYSPQDVLQNYFDELLTTAKSSERPPEVNQKVLLAPRPKIKLDVAKPLAEPVQQRLEQKQKLAKLLTSAPPVAEVVPVVDVAPAVEPVVEVLVDSSVVDVDVDVDIDVRAKVNTEVSEAEPAVEKRAFAWLENGRPAWAQERFEVLLFSVSGLTLAVPLIALGQIQPLTDELTPLFGQAEWFMGLQPTLAGKVRTINTALFVMPERYDEHFLETARYVISIDGLPWGLAVDQVDQPIMLEPEDVKWRTERSKRPWLAGTVKQHMCALIDIAVMGQQLQAADANAIRQS